MKSTTKINIRVDEELKRQAEEMFAELGINMSTAMNMFLRQAVRHGGIPFDLRVSKPNAETMAAIKETEKGQNMSKEFDSVDELMEDLNA